MFNCWHFYNTFIYLLCCFPCQKFKNLTKPNGKKQNARWREKKCPPPPHKMCALFWFALHWRPVQCGRFRVCCAVLCVLLFVVVHSRHASLFQIFMLQSVIYSNVFCCYDARWHFFDWICSRVADAGRCRRLCAHQTKLRWRPISARLRCCRWYIYGIGILFRGAFCSIYSSNKHVRTMSQLYHGVDRIAFRVDDNWIFSTCS